MEGVAGQIGLPVLGIVAVAAATFYVVSFLELREKSFKDLDDMPEESMGRRARRKAERKAKKK